MHVDLPPEVEAFREEVRAFIDANLDEQTRRAHRLTPTLFSEPDVGRAWHQALFEKGWVAPGWPKEHGGTGWSPIERYVFEVECAKASAPIVSPLGLRMVGPVVIRYGSQEQKDFYLPRILSGEDYWCQGYSESDAGSDLASLRTNAVRDGDRYIINGSKMWTTHAHFANRMFALVRTSQGAKKQEGITFILIDMATPGINIRPILTIGGDHEVNEVFFDNVSVPRGNVVGEEGQGWTYGKYLLEFERAGAFAAARLHALLDRMIALLPDGGQRGRPDRDGSILSRISELRINLYAIETIELKMLSTLQAGGNPGVMSSLVKLRASELRQQIHRIGCELLGRDSLRWQRQRPLYGANERVLPDDRIAVVPTYLDGRAFTIFGGSAEIQRDILAKSMLKL